MESLSVPGEWDMGYTWHQDMLYFLAKLGVESGRD